MEIQLISPEHGTCRILAKTNVELEPIRAYFSTPNPSKFFVMHNNPNFSVPDYIYGISALGVFKIGLLTAVLNVMKKLQIPYMIDPEILKSFSPFSTHTVLPTVHELPCEQSEDFEYRDYQHEAVERNLARGRGIIVMATASGKSFVIAKTLHSLLESFPDDIKHCLILVPTTSLVIQFHKDLLSYGLGEDDVSMFSSKQRNCLNTKIIISNRQWLERHKDDLPHIDVLQVDEAHTFSSPNSKSVELVDSFETNLKFGCTATLPNTLDKKWELIGLIGPVLFKKTARDMQEDNYISDLLITSIYVHDKVINKDKKCLFSLNRTVTTEEIQMPYELERKYIVDNMKRLYSQPIDHIKSITQGTNTLYLFDFIEFGVSLYEYIKEQAADPSKVFYIDGKIDVDIREQIRQDIENTEDAIVVAQSVCFNTGINIKKLHNICFVFNSKSGTKIIQSIGRGLRKHESKTHTNLFDINFNFKYSQKHHRERKSIYLKEYNKKVSQVVKFKI